MTSRQEGTQRSVPNKIGGRLLNFATEVDDLTLEQAKMTASLPFVHPRNWIQRQFSQQGGTTWGDIFMANIGNVIDPVARLRQIIQSGHAWYIDENAEPFQGSLDLDRMLHHEERHSQ